MAPVLDRRSFLGGLAIGCSAAASPLMTPVVLASAPWDRLVLSSEGLSSLHIASLRKLRDWLSRYADDWTVLLWSRHPVAFTNINIQQRI